MPLAVHHQQTSVVPPAKQEGFTPFRPLTLVSSTDPVRRFLHPQILSAVGEFSPVTPSPGVGVPQAPSTSSVSHPPLVDAVCNLEHLLADLRLQDIKCEAPATDRGQLHTLPAPSILSFEGGKSKETCPIYDKRLEKKKPRGLWYQS